MKRIINILAIILVSTTLTWGQIIEGDDGIYYASNYEPYSGEYTEEYDNGSTRIEMNLNEGVKDGFVKLFFSNGNLNELRSYKNGLMHGKWETFNINNVKIAEANYKNNKKDGKWLIWDDNGTLRCEMYYNKDKKVGKWSRWDENGDLIESKEY